MASASLGNIARRILKGIAVFTGFILLVFGGLIAAAATQNLVADLNQPGAGKVPLAIQIACIVIMAGVALFGIALIWLGFKGKQPTAEVSVPSAAAPVPAELGRLIAQCGPQQDGQLHYVLIGVALIVFAGACFVAPSTFLKPKPGDCCVFCSYGTVPCPPIQAGKYCS